MQQRVSFTAAVGINHRRDCELQALPDLVVADAADGEGQDGDGDEDHRDNVVLPIRSKRVGPVQVKPRGTEEMMQPCLIHPAWHLCGCGT